VKHGLDTLAGVIDPDYTGEVKVVLQNMDMQQPFVIRPGYRIAQLILENYTSAEVVEIPSENTPLNVQTQRGDSAAEAAAHRGASGFGSTGYAVTGI
jgi:dUTP pyrophosphatase